MLNRPKSVSVFGFTAVIPIVSLLLLGTQRVRYPNFPSVVNAAMTKVQRGAHTVLFAPTGIPRTPPSVLGRQTGYPVARVQAARTWYTVTIDYAHHPLRVNSKRWARENLDPMLNSYLVFGARQYATRRAALAVVRQQDAIPLGSWSRVRRVVLAPHWIATYRLSDQKVSVMTWHEHGWRITMAGSFAASSPAQAKAWATGAATTFMAAVPSCPSHHGVLIQEGGGSMNSVTAMWTIGSTMYTVESGFGMHPVAKAITTWKPWQATAHGSLWTRVNQWWDYLVR